MAKEVGIPDLGVQVAPGGPTEASHEHEPAAAIGSLHGDAPWRHHGSYGIAGFAIMAA